MIGKALPVVGAIALHTFFVIWYVAHADATISDHGSRVTKLEARFEDQAKAFNAISERLARIDERLAFVVDHVTRK